MSDCLCVSHNCAWDPERLQKASDPLELKFQMLMSSPLWVMGLTLWSFARAVRIAAPLSLFPTSSKL